MSENTAVQILWQWSLPFWLLWLQTTTEQLSAKHTDLVFAEAQGSGPPLGCGNVRETGR